MLLVTLSRLYLIYKSAFKILINARVSSLDSSQIFERLLCHLWFTQRWKYWQRPNKTDQTTQTIRETWANRRCCFCFHHRTTLQLMTGQSSHCALHYKTSIQRHGQVNQHLNWKHHLLMTPSVWNATLKTWSLLQIRGGMIHNFYGLIGTIFFGYVENADSLWFSF